MMSRGAAEHLGSQGYKTWDGYDRIWVPHPGDGTLGRQTTGIESRVEQDINKGPTSISAGGSLLMEFKKCDRLDIPDSGLHRGIRTAAGAKTSTLVKGITTKGADKETHLCFVTHVAYVSNLQD